MSVTSSSDTEIEAALTSLDSSSAGEPVICVSDIEDDMPHAKDGIEHWQTRCDRFSLIYEELKLNHNIIFKFSSAAFADMRAAQMVHAQYVIDALLKEGYIQSFKIGLTHLPKDRFYSVRYGYQRSGYNKMVLLAVHDNCDFIKDMEIKLLAVYRRHDRHGILVNFKGHPLCANRAPGGEGADHGFAPFFVYVALKTNPRTDCSEGLTKTEILSLNPGQTEVDGNKCPNDKVCTN